MCKSEPVSPTGSLSSIGILNQLGRPQLDVLALLVRETVQNSWDARLSDEISVAYSVYGWQLKTEQRRTLRERIFHDRPHKDSLPLDKIYSNDPLYGLIIADRGTTGLEGPTRADIVPKGSSRRFINFLRDVGNPSDQKLSGGTYGYGKASLYLASGIKTILVHTRCRGSSNLVESRFIAAALGKRWEDKRQRQYTGRHWWGSADGDIAEPITGPTADKLAAELGMGHFKDDETGTTILILDPILNDLSTGTHNRAEEERRTPLQALNLMAEYALWFFWPKMLKSESGSPAIQFDFNWEDTPINLPDPTSYPPLAGFATCMQHIKGQQGDAAVFPVTEKEISSDRPRKLLGRLALRKFPVQEGYRFNTGTSMGPFSNMTHHTALMRQAELVVKYLEGKPLNTNTIGYAGVFITDIDVDEVFAQSEPPTHDDWSPDSLVDSWHKRFIRIALRRIKDEMTGFAQSLRSDVASGTMTPLGGFSTWLAETLMPTERGTSASRPLPAKKEQFPEFPIRSDTNGLYSEPTPGHSSSVDNQLAVDDTNVTSSHSADISVNSSHWSDDVAAEIEPAPMIPLTEQLDEGRMTPAPAIRGHSKAVVVSDELIEHHKQPALRLGFNVQHANNARGTTVCLHAEAVLDGNTIENEPPLGGSTPEVLFWRSPSDHYYEDNQNCIFISAEEQTINWEVFILLPDDIMVNVSLSAHAEAHS